MSGSDEDEVCRKRMKSAVTDSVNSTLNDLSEFEIKSLLSENSQRKTVCLHGKFTSADGEAVVFLEKKPFDEKDVRELLKRKCPLSQLFCNDIYGNFECSPAPEFNKIKATVIHPATEKHISKYKTQPVHLIEETGHLYNIVTLPHLQKEQFSLQWVMNILDHKSEEERIVFEDPDPEKGFVLLPDLKWDGKQTENLYLIAIVRKLGILSLRDLRSSHLDLLKNILVKGCAAIEKKYNILRSQLRIYIHYQPSFYHLHVHFTNLQYDAPGIHAGSAHLLQTVINNIELLPDYYEKTCSVFMPIEERFILYKIVKINIKSSFFDIVWSFHGKDIVQRVNVGYCKLIPYSLSCLQIADGFVSFRLQIEPMASASGSCSGISLSLPPNDACDKWSCSNSNAADMKPGKMCGIVCRCCGNKLSLFKCERVLPLPSGMLDSVEWFCHGHNSSPALEPRIGDLLYAQCCFLIHKETVNSCAFGNSSSCVASCKRCLAWLGTQKPTHVVLWDCSVGLGDSPPPADPVGDFKNVIVYAIKSCVSPMCRLVLETQLTDTVTHYLLLWVIDKNLQLLTSSEFLIEDPSVVEKDHVFESSLESENALKLLYRHQSSCTATVKAWQNDVNVQTVDVAKLMFTEGLKHLSETTKRIPHSYRITNDFFTAFLEIT